MMFAITGAPDPAGSRMLDDGQRCVPARRAFPGRPEYLSRELVALRIALAAGVTRDFVRSKLQDLLAELTELTELTGPVAVTRPRPCRRPCRRTETCSDTRPPPRPDPRPAQRPPNPGTWRPPISYP
jgi:hypothetical protein